MNKIDSIFYQSLELSPNFEFDIRINRNQSDILYRGFGRYDLHYHSNWEIDYVIGGDGETILRNAVYTFEPGDIYIIKPYQMHNSYTTSEIELICIQFNLESVIQSVFSDLDFNEEMNKNKLHFADLIRASDPNHPEIKRIITAVIDEWRTKKIGWHSATRLLLAQLFIELMRNYRVEANEPEAAHGSDNLGIRTALDYINTNYTRQIRLEQVAQKAIMQKNYFCTQFKKHIGCTYYTYLNNLRLKHACTLLLSTEQNVKNIALNSGFLDISTFNKAFKKALNITPSEYRDLHGKTEQKVGIH